MQNNVKKLNFSNKAATVQIQGNGEYLFILQTLKNKNVQNA